MAVAALQAISDRRERGSKFSGARCLPHCNEHFQRERNCHCERQTDLIVLSAFCMHALEGPKRFCFFIMMSPAFDCLCPWPPGEATEGQLHCTSMPAAASAPITRWQVSRIRLSAHNQCWIVMHYFCNALL